MTPAALTVCLAAACALGCTSGPETLTGVVNTVVDGDTIRLESGETIRYLLVDTPESTNGADDCYGTESAQFNRDLVLGKEVSVTFDPAEMEDRFGRLLGYVEVDGIEVNTRLVERGFACVLYIPPAGEERRSEFEALERMAQAQNRGLWGACEEVTCD